MLMHIIFSADSLNIRFIPSTRFYSLPSGSYMPPVRCIATCNTICTYKWTKNGMYMAGQTLAVGRVSSSSAGTYTCTASEGNRLRNISIEKSLTLNVPCKYTIVVLRKSETLKGYFDKQWPQNAAFYQGLHCLPR